MEDVTLVPCKTCGKLWHPTYGGGCCEAAEPDTPPADRYEELTVKQLVAYALEQGVEVDKNAKKADLIAAIRAAEQSTTEPPQNEGDRPPAADQPPADQGDGSTTEIATVEP